MSHWCLINGANVAGANPVGQKGERDNQSIFNTYNLLWFIKSAMIYQIILSHVGILNFESIKAAKVLKEKVRSTIKMEVKWIISAIRFQE